MTDTSLLNGIVYCLLILWFIAGIEIKSRDNTINGLKSIQIEILPVILGIIFYFLTNNS